MSEKVSSRFPDFFLAPFFSVSANNMQIWKIQQQILNIPARRVGVNQKFKDFYYKYLSFYYNFIVRN